MTSILFRLSPSEGNIGFRRGVFFVRFHRRKTLAPRSTVLRLLYLDVGLITRVYHLVVGPSRTVSSRLSLELWELIVTYLLWGRHRFSFWTLGKVGDLPCGVGDAGPP